MKAIEFAIKIFEKRKRYFENKDFYLKLIKDRAIKTLPDAKIYLFGSVVEGNYHPAVSDIDVAVVSQEIPDDAGERAKIRLKLKEGFEFSPFEVHLLTLKEWEFYKLFIEKFEEI